MDPKDLISAAYAFNVDGEAREAAFERLITQAEAAYRDQNARFEMTSEDLGCTYSL